MTGKEFSRLIKESGYSQARFAEEMGVHRSTIATRCAEKSKVEPYWVFALKGFIESKKSSRTEENKK